MDEKALVSVIIPLYNAEAYISECIKSVLAQTCPNIEVIIIDDGSTDNSAALAETFASSEVKLYRQANKGASTARNYGLREAKGKYIQFLDADDLLSADKIEAQVGLLEQNPGCIAICDTVYFDDGTDPYQNKPVKEWYSNGFNEPVDFLIKLYGGDLIGPNYGGMVQPNAWLTSRHVIDKAGLWNEMRSPDDDGEFFCRVILESEGVCYAPGAVNYYRKLAGNKNLSAQKDQEACQSKLTVTDLKAKHLLRKSDSDKAKLALSRLYWENAFAFYPEFKKLAREAEIKAKMLAPHLRIRAYSNGLKSFLSKIFGWKSISYLQYLKGNFSK